MSARNGSSTSRKNAVNPYQLQSVVHSMHNWNKLKRRRQMEIVKFPEHNVVYAENQPGYQPLPAFKVGDDQGSIICCWSLSWRERIKVLFTGRIWHRILTF